MFWLRRQLPVGRTATNLYGSIVTQVRQPYFYRVLGLPDTINARYELLVMHLSIVLEALNLGGSVKDADRVRRALVEHFVADMDDTMRELAVGDTSVPRKVKKLAAGLMDRSRDYASAFSGDSGPGASAAVLAEVFEHDQSSPIILRLSKYAHRLLQHVSHPEVAVALRSGQLTFPPFDLLAD
ncbi:MAG: ubiquinol-cytochrome C chaperone family protein [Hyphomicrobiaceae bacterium]